MPSPITNLSPVSLINNLTDTRSARDAGAIQGILTQLQGAGQEDNVAIANALDKARTAQQATAFARDAGQTLNQVENKLKQMRDLAARAASTTDPTQRQRLATEFNRLQGEVNDIGGSKVAFNGKPLLAGVNTTSTAATTGVQFAGRASGPTAGEGPQAVEQSRAAAAAGVKNVQVTDQNANSRVSFIDLGNGRLTAIRYDRGADGVERQVSSQTIEVAAPAQGQTTTANFDRLGVQATLDDRYRAGALQGAEVRSGPQAAARTTAAQSNEVKPFALDITDQGKASDAVKAIDAALARVEGRRGEIKAFQSQQSQTIRDSFALLARANRGNRSGINFIG